MSTVVWLDPSLENVNAGDEIIAQSIEQLGLAGLDGAARLTTHRMLRPSEVGLINSATHVLVGGTNILNSRQLVSRQWVLPPWQVAAMRHKTVFLGVGWWQYQRPPTRPTASLLKYLSHPEIPHSVRDSYTAKRMDSMRIRSLMTGCPTMWSLEDRIVTSPRDRARALITVTDYHFDHVLDAAWLGVVRETFGELLAVGMGPGDENALRELAQDLDIQWLGSGRKALDLARGECDFHVGTRLHAAVHWLQKGGESLIVSVDNRATEIGHDTGLPVVAREDTATLRQRLEMDWETSLKLPAQAIRSWRNAWNSVWRAL